METHVMSMAIFLLLKHPIGSIGWVVPDELRTSPKWTRGKQRQSFCKLHVVSTYCLDIQEFLLLYFPVNVNSIGEANLQYVWWGGSHQHKENSIIQTALCLFEVYEEWRPPAFCCKTSVLLRVTVFCIRYSPEVAEKISCPCMTYECEIYQKEIFTTILCLIRLGWHLLEDGDWTKREALGGKC